MAKTESTAVNALIDLVHTSKRLPTDPSDDEMFRAPAPAKKSAPRMTGTVSPTLRGAGEVAPLPRHRTPVGTQPNTAIPAPAPGVRVSATPVRTMTIPPINSRSSGEMPAIPAPVSIPPSARMKRPSEVPPAGPPAPELFSMNRPSRPSLPPPMRTTAPASMPVAAPFEPRKSGPVAVAAIAMPMHIPPPADMTSNQMWFDAHQSDNELPINVDDDSDIVPIEGTDKVKKNGTLALIGKLVVPTLGLAIVGVFVGGFVAFNGEGGTKNAAAAGLAGVAPVAKTDTAKTDVADLGKPATADTNAATADTNAAKTDEAAPEKAVATDTTAKAEAAVATGTTGEAAVAKDPVATAAVEAAKQPAITLPTEAPKAPAPGSLVDVRIDSQPSGATVMLVDRGKTTFLGSTPIATAVDPSRQYDIVFTYENKPTQLEHLDPNATHHMSIVLGKSGNTAAKIETKAPPASKIVAPAPAPKTETKAAPAVKTVAPVAKTEKRHAPTTKVVTPSFGDTVETPKAEKAEKIAVAPAAPKADVGGEGTLMISSKPPCEIMIDGKATGMMTPQRAITLPAGAHKITLVSPDKTLKKTVSVTISSDKPTKVIQDLLAK